MHSKTRRCSGDPADGGSSQQPGDSNSGVSFIAGHLLREPASGLNTSASHSSDEMIDMTALFGELRDDDTFANDEQAFRIPMENVYAGIGGLVQEGRHGGRRSSPGIGHLHFIPAQSGILDFIYDAFRDSMETDEVRHLIMYEGVDFNRLTGTSAVSPQVLLDYVPVTRIKTAEEAISLGSCPICLNEYKARMLVRVLPDCGHSIHKTCFDKWVWRAPRYSCPLDNIEIRIPELESSEESPCYEDSAGSLTTDPELEATEESN